MGRTKTCLKLKDYHTCDKLAPISVFNSFHICTGLSFPTFNQYFQCIWLLSLQSLRYQHWPGVDSRMPLIIIILVFVVTNISCLYVFVPPSTLRLCSALSYCCLLRTPRMHFVTFKRGLILHAGPMSKIYINNNRV